MIIILSFSSNNFVIRCNLEPEYENAKTDNSFYKGVLYQSSKEAIDNESLILLAQHFENFYPPLEFNLSAFIYVYQVFRTVNLWSFTET